MTIAPYLSKNNPNKKQRIGKMLISESLLLDWLQFPKAKIRSVFLDPYRSDTIVIVLEDKEMPEIEEGDAIPVVTPLYILTINKKGEVTKRKREKLNEY